MDSASILLQEITPEQTEEELTTLVVDHNLRVIHIPSSIKVLGVASDDEVMQLNFKVPRYISITDLSEFSFRINYENARGIGDVYTIEDMVVDDDSITFSWLVGPIATAYKGMTKFSISAVKLDADDYVEKEYNTTPAALEVLEGLEADPGVVTAYSDVIEQWRQLLFSSGRNVIIDSVTGIAYALKVSNGTLEMEQVSV